MLKELSVITIEEEIGCDLFFQLFQKSGKYLTVKTRCPRSTVDKEGPVVSFLSAMEKPDHLVPAAKTRVSSRRYFCSQKCTKRTGAKRTGATRTGRIRETGYLPGPAFKRLLWRVYYQFVVPLRLRTL